MSFKRGFFHIEELVDKATFEKLGEKAWELLHPNIVSVVTGLRVFFGSPVTVNNYLFGGSMQYRGYRGIDCPVGSYGSWHRRGMAVDCDIHGKTAGEAREIILACAERQELIHIQRIENLVDWLHVDIGFVPKGKSRIYLFNP